MNKIPFLTNDRLSRLMVSLLLCMGLLLPLMMSFGAGSAMLQAILIAAALLALLCIAGSFRRAALIVPLLLAAGAAVQLLLPGMGFFGAAVEAVKAIALYFNDVPAAAPMFAGDIALLLAVTLAVVCYLFTSRSVGFFPAIILVVLTLFGMWSLGQAQYLWYTTPAFVALLLLISQTSHEKTNLFEVLPMAAVVVALAMLVLPAGQTVIEPLHQGAMRLKQTIEDHLFFTDPRNVFTLGNYGYYPMGSGKLGGAAQPSDIPVMTVKTDRRTLLRAVAKDEYTGRSWRDTSNAKRYLYVNPRWSALRQSVFLEELPPASVQRASTLLDQHAVTVQMQDSATSTVPVPAYLRTFSAQSDMVAYFNASSELFITRDLARGDRYTAFAPIVEGGDSALGSLISAAPKGADKYYQDALDKYTDLPAHLEQKVFEDLNNIVSGYNTPYDQACAIMRHLKRYYRYTLEPSTPPENQDFVTYFLYVSKEGYCTYYASAMTVLCRMAGLPARYVEGFIAKPSTDGFAYVTGQDAHAWTEVYFEGFGWVPFDPTPTQDDQDSEPPMSEPEPQPTPTPPPPEQQDAPTPTPLPDEVPDETGYDEDDRSFPWLWLLLLALIAAAAVRVILCLPDRVAKRQTDELGSIFVYGSAVNALLLLTKRTPRPGETPLAFARRMDRLKSAPAPILPLWRMMALSNYSRTAPGAEQTAQAREIFQRFYHKQKLFTRIRFLTWAAFGRGLYASLDTQLKHEEPAQPYSYASALARKNASGKRKLTLRSKDKKECPSAPVKREAPPAPVQTAEPEPAPEAPMEPETEPETTPETEPIAAPVQEPPRPARRRRSDRSKEDE